MRTSTEILFVALGLFLFVNIVYAAEVENMARNSSFENGTLDWQLLVTAPAAAQ